jgi:hypothetical protein
VQVVWRTTLAFDNDPDLMPYCSGAVKWSGREITSFPLFCTPDYADTSCKEGTKRRLIAALARFFSRRPTGVHYHREPIKELDC